MSKRSDPYPYQELKLRMKGFIVDMVSNDEPNSRLVYPKDHTLPVIRILNKFDVKPGDMILFDDEDRILIIPARFVERIS